MALANHNSAIRRAVLKYVYDIQHMNIISTGTVPKKSLQSTEHIHSAYNIDVM